MAWNKCAVCLPDVGPLGFQSLAGGCGICGDEVGRWLLLWHGSAVAWVSLPLESAGRPGPSEAGGHYFEGRGDVIIARPIAEAHSFAVVLSDGSLCLLHSGASGLGVELAWLPAQSCVDAWPLAGGRSLVLFSSSGMLRQAKVSGRGLGLELVEAKEEAMETVFATTLRHCDADAGRGQARAVAVAAGQQAAGSQTVIRFWEILGGKVASAFDLTLVPPGEANTLGERVRSLTLLPGCRMLCALLADGSLLLARVAAGADWSLCSRISPQRVAGLRLCACGQLDEDLLEGEDGAGAEVPASVAVGLHAWHDGSLSLLFPGVPAGQQEVLAEAVTLAVEAGGQFHLASGEALVALCSADGQASCVAGYGSAGGQLFFLARRSLTAEQLSSQDGSGTLAREHLVCTLERRSLRRTAPMQRGTTASSGALARYRELLSLAGDAEAFAEAVLAFDPFESLEGSKALGCEQLRRLLTKAGAVLDEAGAPNLSSERGTPITEGGLAVEAGDGWGDDLNLELAGAADGWGEDLDLGSLASESLPVEAMTTHEKHNEKWEEPDVLQRLRRRVVCQLSRLAVFQELLNKGGQDVLDQCHISWAEFREIGETALCSLARRLASKQCVTALEALFSQSPELCSHWERILNALPETVEVSEVAGLLPAAARSSRARTVLRRSDGGIAWYIERVRCIVDRTGICRLALELLSFAIHSAVGSAIPPPISSEAMPIAADLPEVPPNILKELPLLPQLYGMFRLCAEYHLYCIATYEEQLESGWPSDETPPPQSFIPLADFCELAPGERARLALRHSGPGAVVKDAQAWELATCLEHCSLGSARRAASHGLVSACELASDVVAQPMDEALMQALLGRLSSTGWDPASFQVLSEVVQASKPSLPRESRLLRSPVRLVEFILSSVYSEDQRCHAVDIFTSVDAMYSCIPERDVEIFDASEEHWNELQRQADELSDHLSCVQILVEKKIKLSISFADLRQGCQNESVAVHLLWNLFRVLGARYRPAEFWRGFEEKLFYLHKHAFAAVSVNLVYDMYVRCLVEQEHLVVVTAVVESWTKNCGGDMDVVASFLVSLSKELVNSSPALRHPSLEKARRVLKCINSHETVRELDFIKACELLHDLVRRKPKHALQWVQSAVQDLRSGSTFAHLSQEMRGMNLSAIKQQVSQVTSGATMSSLATSLVSDGHAPTSKHADAEASGRAAAAEGFCIDTPVQLRLRLHQPIRIVTNLLEFNPPILLESEDLHRFCSLIGLLPTSGSWAEVMALCGAANLLCGDRAEALSITEKLLVNAHPGSWKLALALAADMESVMPGTPTLGLDCGSGLLADAAKVCPDGELPRLLSFFRYGPPNSGKPSLPLDKELHERVNPEVRGYALDTRCLSSLSAEAKKQLDFDEVKPSYSDWRGLELWNEACTEDWLDAGRQQRWAQDLLTVDRDAGVALLHAAGAPLPATAVPAMGCKQQPEGQVDAQVDAHDAFPVSFNSAEGGLRDFQQDPHSRDAWEMPETDAAKSALVGVAGQSADFAEAERQVYQKMLPALQSPEATRNIVSRAAQGLHQLGYGPPEESSARLLLCRDVLDMCDELAKDADDGRGSYADSGECPETEPDGGSQSSFTSALRAVHEACPGLGIARERSDLAKNVLKHAGESPSSADALRLARAVAGVTELEAAGVSPSAVALRAAQAAMGIDGEASPQLAPLIPWLSLEDSLELLRSIVENQKLSRSRKLEVIAHLRNSGERRGGTQLVAEQLEEAVRQAEGLVLLQSVFESQLPNETEFPLSLHTDMSIEAVHKLWLQQISDLPTASKLLPTAEALLETGFG
eukprot:TRINITY_DN39266_c0_g1_i2.p1 TRINITY_DN39266_c0_g1~~TRINITY_DN39266_c0_g1_i2.p1  ORF type:complete len:1819 (+),score=380.50 TRINITY_DN39266_c0_g1_i2:19-5475(+)